MVKDTSYMKTPAYRRKASLAARKRFKNMRERRKFLKSMRKKSRRDKIRDYMLSSWRNKRLSKDRLKFLKSKRLREIRSRLMKNRWKELNKNLKERKKYIRKIFTSTHNKKSF